jgi:hypothetical protein
MHLISNASPKYPVQMWVLSDELVFAKDLSPPQGPCGPTPKKPRQGICTSMIKRHEAAGEIAKHL